MEKERGLVLVTGASGFTGHHMVMEAVRAGFKVRATDVSSRYYSAMYEAMDVEFIPSNLTRREGLDRLLEGVEGVFHVAGIHNYSTPDKVIFAINVGGVENVCSAAVKAGVKRFIHWSSVGVYGYDWKSGQAVTEEAEKLTPPLNNYNVSKWEGEKVVQRYAGEEGLQATILRPAAIYGKRSEYGLFNAFKAIWQARDKKKIQIIGKGDKTEAFLHVEDMCRSALHVYDLPETVGEAYNVADDSRITSAQFFKFLSKEILGEERELQHLPMGLVLTIAALSQFSSKFTGKKPVVEKATARYMDYDRIWDNTKLKQTGFRFKYPKAEDGLRETLEWYKDHGWLEM